jgi:hypothetical protein
VDSTVAFHGDGKRRRDAYACEVRRRSWRTDHRHRDATFAGPASAIPLAHVVPGGVWTIADLPPDNSCDVITFGAGYTWIDAAGTQSGTYRGGGSSIRMHWKTGPEAAIKLAFAGTYTRSLGGYYSGTFTDTKGTSSGALVPGVQC